MRFKIKLTKNYIFKLFILILGVFCWWKAFELSYTDFQKYVLVVLITIMYYVVDNNDRLFQIINEEGDN